MAKSHEITVNGQSFVAGRGEAPLDAALKHGIDLPYDCRAGPAVPAACGWYPRSRAGKVPSRASFACQCRIVGDAGAREGPAVRCCTVEGVVSSLRPVARGVRKSASGPTAPSYHPGQYAAALQRLSGRPFQHQPPLRGNRTPLVCAHIRRMKRARPRVARGGTCRVSIS